MGLDVDLGIVNKDIADPKIVLGDVTLSLDVNGVIVDIQSRFIPYDFAWSTGVDEHCDLRKNYNAKRLFVQATGINRQCDWGIIEKEVFDKLVVTTNNALSVPNLTVDAKRYMQYEIDDLRELRDALNKIQSLVDHQTQYVVFSWC